MQKKKDAGVNPASFSMYATFEMNNSDNLLVEVEGVEPSSEHIAIQLSPSADVILCFALRLPDDGPSHCYPKEFPLKPIGISLKVSHY